MRATNKASVGSSQVHLCCVLLCVFPLGISSKRKNASVSLLLTRQKPFKRSEWACDKIFAPRFLAKRYLKIVFIYFFASSRFIVPFVLKA